MTTDRIYFGAVESYEDLWNLFQPLYLDTPGTFPVASDVLFAWVGDEEAVVVYRREGQLYVMDDGYEDRKWTPVRTTWSELAGHYLYDAPGRDTRASRLVFRALVDSHVRTLHNGSQESTGREAA